MFWMVKSPHNAYTGPRVRAKVPGPSVLHRCQKTKERKKENKIWVSSTQSARTLISDFCTFRAPPSICRLSMRRLAAASQAIFSQTGRDRRRVGYGLGSSHQRAPRVSAAVPPDRHPPPAQVISAVAKCGEHSTPSVQLAVLQALLTATTAEHFVAHGDCLMQAVRTAFNIAIGSDVPDTQRTARGALLQMLNTTLKRVTLYPLVSPSLPVWPPLGSSAPPWGIRCMQLQARLL